MVIAFASIRRAYRANGDQFIAWCAIRPAAPDTVAPYLCSPFLGPDHLNARALLVGITAAPGINTTAQLIVSRVATRRGIDLPRGRSGPPIPA